MSSKALRRTAAILLLVVLTAFSAAPAHAVLDESGHAAALAACEPGHGIIAFLLRLILKTGGGDSGGSNNSTTTTTTTTTATTRQAHPQDTGGAMDPNG